MYHLLFHSKVEKQLSGIPRKNAKRLADKIRKLKENPRPEQSIHLDIEMYRLRDGDYRVIYAVFDDDNVVYVGAIRQGNEKTYKDINRLLSRAINDLEERKLQFREDLDQGG